MASGGAKTPSVMDATLSAMADVYAEALLDRTESDHQALELTGELEELVDVLTTMGGLDDLLAAAMLNVHQRRELVEKVFHGRVSELVEAFLSVLARRNRLALLKPAVRRMRTLIDKRRGKIEVAVTTPFELDPEHREELIEGLQLTFGAEVILTTNTDKDILGGAIVRVEDRVFDASVSGRLKRLALNLTERIAGQSTQQVDEKGWP